MIEEYCPKVLEDGYAEMLVKLEKCPICDTNMLAPHDERCSYERSLFHLYWRIDFKHQLKNAGWHLMSDIKVDDKYICQDCASAGKANFLCALCGERKPTDKKRDSFGDPPDHLCIDCYESATAKVWNDKVEELEELHRWDFE